MFKKFAIAIVMFVLPLGAMAQSKLAHMNSQEIIVEMQEYKDAVANLESRQKGYHSLPRNIAERREKEINDMNQRYQEFQQEASQAMQQAQQEAMNPILQKVSDAVQAIGKADGYTYVIDLANSSVTYVGTDAVDITAKIKAQLGIK